ncbi:bifunctional acetate--CoA ligase family protein/GNAT family N-acetyltransferase [Rhodovibrionaceae bacterium A322]
MSLANFDKVFAPRSIALIGASNRPKSVGQVLAKNLFNSSFSGPIMPVHPRNSAVEGVLAYASVAELPLAPDLAVVCTPPDTVSPVIEQLIERGNRAAVVITAGFGESNDAEGLARAERVLQLAREHAYRIVGPNCVGTMMPHLGVNATFSHINALKGDLAFVTQSGAMVTAMLDWATPRGIGFSHVVSMGDMLDVDFGDMLNYLALDPKTRAILLYVEAVTDARKFMSAARAAARGKPVIVIKGGRQAEGAKAAASHTGALAGSDEVYNAAFQRAGMLRVTTLEELFDAAQTLATARPLSHGGKDKLAILTNGGGLGVLATDALVGQGGRLASLSAETIEKMNAHLPATWSHGNPVDIIGDAPGSRYAAALDALLEDQDVDAVLVMNCPTAVSDMEEAARAVVDTYKANKRRPKKPLFTAWLGQDAPQSSRQFFNDGHYPTYDTPERAVRGFMHLVRYRRGRELLMETPDAHPEAIEPDMARAKALMAAVRTEGREWLSEPESKELLSLYGIPVVSTRHVAGEEEVKAAARDIGFPVALKIVSPEITHKSEVGGVMLNLQTEEEVSYAAHAMAKRVKATRPDATLQGFSVQSMSNRPGAIELILGMTLDHQFGPAILFGEGGTAVEVVADKAVALPPLNMSLAHHMMEETRVYKRLKGYRDQPAADLDAIAHSLVKLSQLAADLADVAEVDINPLLADSKGVVALDARVRLTAEAAVEGVTSERLAIRPYPRRLEGQLTLLDGRAISIRPIRPEDEPALKRMVGYLTKEDLRLRFFTYVTELTHETAARLTQIDYDREMAFVALDPDDSQEIWGVVRLSCDPDNQRGEYAVALRSNLKGQGLGFALMQRILDHADQRGVAEVWGSVLKENHRMLDVCQELGFTRKADPDDASVVIVTRKMGEA